MVIFFLCFFFLPSKINKHEILCSDREVKKKLYLCLCAFLHLSTTKFVFCNTQNKNSPKKIIENLLLRANFFFLARCTYLMSMLSVYTVYIHEKLFLQFAKQNGHDGKKNLVEYIVKREFVLVDGSLD